MSDITEKPLSTSETSSQNQDSSSVEHEEPPTKKPLITPGPPPDGGLQAWLQVVGAFFFVFNTWGLTNAFGVFQTYYSTELLRSSSPSAISWIGSIQAFLLLFIGVGCGRALDAGYFYPVAATGIFLEVFGMMMTSLGTKYYQIFLAQGLCVGLGSGCLFTPSISIVNTYFAKKRSLAQGLTAAGSSIGGIIYPIVVRRLIVQIGFAWAVRVMGFIMLATLSVGISLLRPRLPPRKTGPLVDFTVFKDPAYTLFVIALLLSFMAFFNPFFYSESYALYLGVDQDTAFYILAIMNTAGAFGRAIPNAIADWTGNLNAIIPCAIFSAIIALAWIGVKSFSGLIVICIFYALTSGGIMALPPPVIVALSPDLSQIGVRMGMALTIGSFGVLVGTPISGAILAGQSAKGANGEALMGQLKFSGIWIFTGVVLVFATFLMVCARCLKKKQIISKI